MELFESLDDLKPFIFRIVDNGGETYDRITVATCDGDGILCTGGGSICTTVESLDPRVAEEEVEAGTARDLRWIDLPEGLGERIRAYLNQGFADYLEAAPAAASRAEARDWGGIWNEYGDNRTPIYTKDGAFYIRDDEQMGYSAEGEPGPFATFAEAVRRMLPEDYDCSGPEYFTTVDLWSEEGGPAPLWDREADPPVIDENNEQARVVIVYDPGNLKPGDQLTRVAWFANRTDAQNFLSTSATIDPDDLETGRYTIDDLDDPDAK